MDEIWQKLEKRSLVLSAERQALSFSVVELLKLHETLVNVSVAVLFLRAGVEYFKHNDRKALMKLAREERAPFTKELQIE